MTPDPYEAWTKSLCDGLLLSWDIHPYPCPDCGTSKLKPGTWICDECGKDRR